jgi:class 3 adenylate cyclase
MKLPFKMPKTPEQRNRVMGIVLGVAVALSVGLSFNDRAEHVRGVSKVYDFMKRLEYKLYDMRFQIRGPITKKHIAQDIVLLDIDDESYDWQPWPYDRTLYSEVIRALGTEGSRTKATFFDVFFFDPSGPALNKTMADIFQKTVDGIPAAFNDDQQIVSNVKVGLADISARLQGPVDQAGLNEIRNKLAGLIADKKFTGDLDRLNALTQFMQESSTFQNIAPDRDAVIHDSIKEAGNVFLAQIVEKREDTPFGPDSVLFNPKIHDMFARLIQLSDRTKTVSQTEMMVNFAISNMTVSNFKRLLDDSEKDSINGRTPLPFSKNERKKITEEMQKAELAKEQALYVNYPLGVDLVDKTPIRKVFIGYTGLLAGEPGAGTAGKKKKKNFDEEFGKYAAAMKSEFGINIDLTTPMGLVFDRYTGALKDALASAPGKKMSADDLFKLYINSLAAEFGVSYTETAPDGLKLRDYIAALLGDLGVKPAPEASLDSLMDTYIGALTGEFGGGVLQQDPQKAQNFKYYFMSLDNKFGLYAGEEEQPEVILNRYVKALKNVYRKEAEKNDGEREALVKLVHALRTNFGLTIEEGDSLKKVFGNYASAVGSAYGANAADVPALKKHFSDYMLAMRKVLTAPAKLDPRIKAVDDTYIHVYSVQAPNPLIGQYVAGAGYVLPELQKDDGTIRSAAPAVIYEGRLYLHIDMMLAMRYLGVSINDLVFYADKIVMKNCHYPGKKKPVTITMPLYQKGTFLVNWAGKYLEPNQFAHRSFRTVYESARIYNVVKKRDRGDPLNPVERGLYESLTPDRIKSAAKDIQFFNNKVSLTGLTAAGTHDLNPVPFSPRFPLVGMHANFMNSVINRIYIRVTPFWLLFAMLLGLSVLVGYAGGVAKQLFGALITFAAAAGYFVFAALLFSYTRTWIAIVPVVLAIVLTYLLVVMYRFMTEGQEARKMKAMFSTYVNPQVVDTLIQHPEKLRLGGEKMDLSAMFSMASGPGLSEAGSPEELVDRLNEYFTSMTDEIFKYEGMLDKYEGSIIMAVFGAPVFYEDNAVKACLAALDMQKITFELHKKWEQEGKKPIYTSAGLNSGMMIAGNMGSESRFNYTIMGDAVNLAARLLGANKQYGTRLMISEFTYAKAKDAIIARLLDRIRVKGKLEPVEVYELMGSKDEGLPEGMMKCKEHFDLGIKLYHQMKWDEAAAEFKTALAAAPGDSPSKLYIQRCEDFKAAPPETGEDGKWDGVYTMTTK